MPTESELNTGVLLFLPYRALENRVMQRIGPNGTRLTEAAEVADGVVAEVEKEWEEHLGKRRMKQLCEALSLLREITDPWA
ncbi:hypothetical protein SAMN06272735_5945 [Streptomyces sp. TLI_55]|uniref:hypothetical protein n=1 Tax=Streptomyces sp. TLI_55 TaxID=1938861 RepID=UPI000BCC2175|nr:hypothetical protein [Streptomyces sp. TLI_55]SNX64130.1 hypothetical protein SAMN06272735_5945 [Streptomyces sp. TLI_55]